MTVSDWCIFFCKINYYYYYYYYHYLSVMELGHLLTRSGLTYPEVSSKVCHDSFRQLGNSAGPSGRAVLRRRSAAARLLRSWFRIPPGACMFVCCECCVLSGRGLCDELITRAEESYRLCCVVVCDLETSGMRRP